VEIKKIFSSIYKWEYLWLCLMVIITLVMHFSIINDVKVPILDEVYYAGYYPEQQGDLHYGDAYNILNLHSDARPEHPPLAKLFIATGIAILGDNPVGWRTPAVVFGTISIVLLYFICRRLNMSRRASNIATFLFAFENFSFMLASIAMLDVFFLTLVLAFFLLYLNRKYFASGIFIGLAALAKLFAAMGTPALFVHWIFTKTRQTRWFIATVVLAPVSFVGFLALFDYVITRNWANPLTRIKDMLSLSGSLTFANTSHPASSRPWEWLLNFRPMAFWYSPHYTGAVSPSVWALIIPVVLYMVYRAVRRNDAGLFGFSWFLGTYLLWIPISIFTDRISFIFYFYPSIGAFCLGLGMGLNEALEWVSPRTRKVKMPVIGGITAFFLFHIASFIVLSPVFIRT
jgi:dolichyl-phosphate-mannose-protein mannosyltransferase